MNISDDLDEDVFLAAAKRTDIPPEIRALIVRAYGMLIEQERTILRIESQYSVLFEKCEELERRLSHPFIDGWEHDQRMEAAMEASREEGFRNRHRKSWRCDHCGNDADENNVFFYSSVLQDIANARKGESATVCRSCNAMIEENVRRSKAMGNP